MVKLIMLLGALALSVIFVTIMYVVSPTFRKEINAELEEAYRDLKKIYDDFVVNRPTLARLLKSFFSAVLIAVLSERAFLIIWLNLTIFFVAFVGFWFWFKPKTTED